MKVRKMKTAFTIPAVCLLAKPYYPEADQEHRPVKGNLWYKRFLAACLPSVGTSSLMLPTMTEKPMIKMPMSRKRPSATT
jgi:hypothetical protein